MKTKITLFLVIASLIAAAGPSFADWVAGRDLAANELPDGNGVELVDPNPTVPEWSYGYRGTLADTSLTLFTPAQHLNSFHGSAAVQGYSLGNGDDLVVNTAASAVTYNFGSGNLHPLQPNEIGTNPGPDATNEFTIVRWTAPTAGTYMLSAFWTDLDPNGSTNGATGAITLNGSILFDQDFPNDGGTSTTLTLSLNAGALVDFVTGSQGNYENDFTGFDATITEVPESGTWASAALATAACLWIAAKRRKRTAKI